MLKNSAYAPPGEPPALLEAERMSLIALSMNFLTFGVQVALFFTCLDSLWSNRKKHPRYIKVFLPYITAHLVCGTLGVYAGLYGNLLMFVDNRNFPGGPMAFYAAHALQYPSIYGSVIAQFIAVWLADALLLYRFFIIWGSHYVTLIVPGCLLVVSIVMGGFVMAELAMPGGTFQGKSFNFFLTFWSTEVSFTTLLTLLMVGKLMLMRHRIRRYMVNWDEKNGSPYLTVVAILLESAFLFTAFGIAFIITYVLQSEINTVVSDMIGQISSIAPLLIILRVSRGQAVTENTVKQSASTTLIFGNPSESRTSEPISFSSKRNAVALGESNSSDSMTRIQENAT